MWKKYVYLDEKDDELTSLMKELDEKANVFWPLAHYKSAVKYLHKNPMDIAATGGTNWQKFLPPRFQKVIFILNCGRSRKLKNGVNDGWIRNC